MWLPNDHFQHTFHPHTFPLTVWARSPLIPFHPSLQQDQALWTSLGQGTYRDTFYGKPGAGKQGELFGPFPFLLPWMWEYMKMWCLGLQQPSCNCEVIAIRHLGWWRQGGKFMDSWMISLSCYPKLGIMSLKTCCYERYCYAFQAEATVRQVYCDLEQVLKGIIPVHRSKE